jgi:hypothetical protein
LERAQVVALNFLKRFGTLNLKRRDTEYLTPDIEATFYHAVRHLRKPDTQVSILLNIASFAGARQQDKTRGARF